MSAIPSKPKPKVLIVDDDVDLLEMLSEIFFAGGYKVVTAIDGVDGSFKFTNETFDVILTDIKMPKKDGIKFVQFIQASDGQKMMKPGTNHKATPILLISASVDDYRMEIDLLGNIDILNKPFSSRDVLDKVNQLLNKNSAATSSGSILNFKPGEIVIKEGDKGTDIFFVKEGHLQVIIKDKAGKEVVVSTIKSGEMLGELSFLLKKPRTATVKALTDCILISIPKDKFETVLASQPKWFRVLFETISARLEDTTRLLVEEKSKR